MRLYLLVVSQLGLHCALILLFFHSSQVSMTKLEDQFVKKYGNYPLRSGIWDDLSDVYNDTQRLKRLCTQAHRISKRVTGELVVERCDIRQLYFNDPKYKPIDMEMIIYKINNDFNNSLTKPYYFHIGKGLERDCIFYLFPNDINLHPGHGFPPGSFILDDHVCGIVI